MKEFKNKNVFISGATSDIGIVIAKEFYLRGADLILSDHPQKTDQLQEYRKCMEAMNEGNISLQPIDLYNVGDNINGLKKDCDILVNCAGNNVFKPLIEIGEKDWDSIINVNLKGTFFLTQKIVECMIENKRKGKVVNIGSQHGVVANGLRAPYCISKFGLIGFTKIAALELAQYDILVNCVSPTYVLTNKSKDFLLHPDVQRDYLPRIPLHKYARPMDIARAVLFLCSDDNRMITGENIVIDGGYTIY